MKRPHDLRKSYCGNGERHVTTADAARDAPQGKGQPLAAGASESRTEIACQAGFRGRTGNRSPQRCEKVSSWAVPGSFMRVIVWKSR